MILKKLILNGFKSFADRTEIPIDQGVTCVVGPNGCGKSNIADAIMWVLGEQNPRRLRGGRMGDVVFAGTAERKPKGLAEVTLLLDNTSGILPIAYQELEVTRRLFGSGESEYLINGTKVRLKDLQDIFLDTGIGTDTYSIMEQGKVERILASKPMERRELFEEAAGISKYRIRQEEAVRKLKRTESDLIRIRDIIGELERQVRSLSRQAKRAERYKEVITELRAKEVALIYLEYIGLTNARNDITRRIHETTDSQMRLKAQRAGKESMLEGIQNGWNIQSDELRTLKEKHYVIQSDIEKREEGIRYHRERLGDFDSAEERLNREMQGADDRRAQEEERLAVRRNGLGNLERDVNRLTEEAEAALLEFRQANTSAREKRAEVERLRNEMLDAENAASLARNEMRQIEREIELQLVQKERLVAEGDSSEVERVTLSADLARIESEIKQSEASRIALAQRFTELEAKLAEQEARLEAEQKRAAEVRSELTSKRHRLKFLEDMQARHEGYEDGARRVLDGKARNEAPYAAMHHVLAEAISVESKYEPAIEAALNDELQYLICESGMDALSVLNSLRASNAGRASILPREHLLNKTPYVTGVLPDDAAAQGAVRAIDVVRCEEGVRPIVDLLLGDLVITESLDQALALYALHPNGRRYVTPDGDLLSSRGVLTGGSKEAAGPLARWQEMHRLREEIAVLEKRLFDIELIHGKFGEEISETRTSLTESRRADHALEVRRAALDKEMDGLLRERQRLERVQVMIASEIETIDKQVARYQEKKAELEERLALAQEEVLRLEGSFAEAERFLAGLEEQYNQSSERRNSLELELLEKRKDLERERHEIQNAEAQIRDLSEVNETRKREIENIRKRRSESDASIAKAQEEIENLFSTRDNLGEEIRRKEEQVETFASRRKQIAAELLALEEERTRLQEEASHAETERIRVEVEQKNLERRLQEEFTVSVESCKEREDDIEFRRPVEELRAETQELRDHLARLGIVNELAIEEYKEVKDRFDFNLTQAEDLEKARKALLRTISEIKKTTRDRFLEVFEKIRENFHGIFRQMFGGGKADLLIMEEEGADIMDAGIEIVVQPPGKKLQSIMLLSGGEKACTAIALLFAIYTLKPSPFCLLDEIDAPLDDTNVGRFGALLSRFTDKSQFIIISHNKQTMSLANCIHGVTMEERGVSSIVSVQFGDRAEGNAPGVRGVERLASESTPDPSLTPQSEGPFMRRRMARNAAPEAQADAEPLHEPANAAEETQDDSALEPAGDLILSSPNDEPRAIESEIEAIDRDEDIV